MTNPIVLIGPMGAGKTTLGRKLAKVLERKFIDTDRLVSASHGVSLHNASLRQV